MSESEQPPDREESQISYRDLVSPDWFSDVDNSSIWLSGYHAMGLAPDDFAHGFELVDLVDVRVLLLWGEIRYFDSLGVRFKPLGGHTLELIANAAKEHIGLEGPYSIFIAPYDRDGQPGNEIQARRRITEAVALVEIIHGRNLVYQHIYDNILSLGDGKVTISGPFAVNPASMPTRGFGKSRSTWLRRPVEPSSGSVPPSAIRLNCRSGGGNSPRANPT
jgi:hypothetical protein